MSTKVKLPDSLGNVRALSLPVAIGASLLACILAWAIGDGFNSIAQTYLYAFVLWFGLSLGSFALWNIHQLTGGAWSYMIQRILEAMMKTIWVPCVGFLAIVFGGSLIGGGHTMYGRWMDYLNHPEVIPGVIEAKQWYLNTEYWSLRTLLYWAIWLTLIYFCVARWSKKNEETQDALVLRSARFWAGPFILIYCITMTFAPVDWFMSLEPMWFSTMYGPLFWISQGLTILAFSVLILSALSDTKPISKYLTVKHYHSISSLMCGFIVLWTYMSFSQFLIIWAGNQPEEIHWYLARDDGYFQAILVLLMAGHFFLPFMVLLQKKIKFHINRLKWVCVWILLFRLVDVYYIIMPAFTDTHGDFDYVPQTPWGTFLQCGVMVVALGGFWMFVFLGNLTKLPLLPMYDPRMYDALGFEDEHDAHGEGVAEHA